MIGDNIVVRRWRILGSALAAATFFLAVAVQAVAGEWYPPPVSMSQYGVGPNGWLFALWMLAFAATPLVLTRTLRPRSRTGLTLLTIGAIGAVVMALVPTDPGGAQQSSTAQIHTVGAVLGLAFVPMGILSCLWGIRGPWRAGAAVLMAAVGVSLILLLLAANGWDNTGLDSVPDPVVLGTAPNSAGAPRSWAFWQSVAVVCDHAMLALMVGSVWWELRPHPRVSQQGAS
ncbi:DUF998 domain-containing protein [Nakamurella antarctica]|uniref:DUF998 domain-containing protein n=1 Tax=Nakamurella antarctica TaxID=1902245 RepID=A0A3G8ZVI7_9ACTN|nr:DUF998 domain-containing protein [Nakamurella antarctica]AZI58026.1 DUF998 domain-containing protein [Nakamurella antarctica]